MGHCACLFSRRRWALAFALLAACSKPALLPLPDAATVDAATITTTSDTVAIPPFGSKLLIFTLSGSQGDPVPGAVMRFAILADPATPDSGGARLSFSSAITDDAGNVTLQVIAGQDSGDQKPLKFMVQASADHVTDPPEIPIFVTTGALASVEIVPVFTGVSPTNNSVSQRNVYFYDDTPCAGLSMSNPPVPMRKPHILTPDIPSTTFTNVVTNGTHAVLGIAVDSSHKVMAQGCSDLFGTSLSSQQPMRVRLPLAWIYLSPVGTFNAVSQFSFAPPLAGTGVAHDAWKNLSNDGCDPARLWLDCTIDALGPSSVDDPLDCQPVLENDGPLAVRLSARRATTSLSGTCAADVDESGAPSLDAEVYALFPADPLNALNLGTLPDEIDRDLSILTIQSTLTVTAVAPANTFNIVHELTAIDLPNAALDAPITMTAVAAPGWKVAFAPGVVEGGELQISTDPAPHGFTLGLGSAARFAFASSSLKRRLHAGVNQPFDIRTFIETMTNLAILGENGTVLKGCDALDSLLCAEVSQARGCLQAACLAGLEALIGRLDSSFAALDGPSLDFSLSGSAPIVDRDGDGIADALGSSQSGYWSGTFNTHPAVGTWTAERAPTPVR
jgi:hypothetical protein